MKPLRGLVIVSPGGADAQGGIGTMTRAKRDWMARELLDITVTVLDPRGAGLAWLWPWFFVIAALRLLALRLGGRADLLHVQVSERSSFVRKGLLVVLGRLIGMRVVLHHHGAELIPFFRSSNTAMRVWVRFVVGQADLNIVLGEGWRSFLVEECGAKPDRVAVMHNAIADIGGERPIESSAATRFLVVAHLIPRKGIGDFLHALGMLVEAGIDVEATLAGGGDIERYRAEARALGLAARCTFTGWVASADIPELLNSADVLVLPSLAEGLPMAIIEALSAGVPVIATSVGSIPEVLEDCETALIVPPGDSAALAIAMARIADEPDLARSIAKNGRALFEKNFKIEPYMHRLLALYTRL